MEMQCEGSQNIDKLRAGKYQMGSVEQVMAWLEK